jgi:hypothetical protein
MRFVRFIVASVFLGATLIIAEESKLPPFVSVLAGWLVAGLVDLVFHGTEEPHA